MVESESSSETQVTLGQQARRRWWPPSRRAMLLWSFVGIGAPLCWLAWTVFGPRPRITISRETTYFTQPVTKDGYVDYDRALLAEYGESDMPVDESPMSQLMAKDDWHPVKNPDHRISLFAALQLGHGYGDTFDSNFDEIPDDLPQLRDEIMMRRRSRPFTSFEAPLVAAMLVKNRWWREALREAVKDPVRIELSQSQTNSGAEASLQFFNDDNWVLVDELRMSAMLNIGERRFSEAWLDIELMQTIAERSYYVPSDHHSLASLSDRIKSVVDCGTLAILSRDVVCKDTLQWLKSIPLEFPRSALQFHLNKVLRAQMLGALQQWHQEPRSLIRTDMMSVFVMDMETRWQEYNIDWDNELRVVNMMIDRTLSDVCDLDSFAKQQVAIREIDVEVLGNLQLNMGYQSEWAFQQTNTVTCRSRFAHIAAALVQWKSEHGSLPERLDALTSKGNSLDPKAILDPFNGQPFSYTRHENGFTVYSIGEDLSDDGGLPQSDDIALTWSLPRNEGLSKSRGN